jgi:hypothetical protein
MSLRCSKDVLQGRSAHVFFAAWQSALFQRFLNHLLMDDLDTLKRISPHGVFPSSGRMRCSDWPDAIAHRNDLHGVLMLSEV